MCSTFELATADFAAAGTADRTALDVIDDKQGFKRRRTDHGPGFAVDLAKVLLSVNRNELEAVICTTCIPKSAAPDAKVFRW